MQYVCCFFLLSINHKHKQQKKNIKTQTTNKNETIKNKVKFNPNGKFNEILRQEKKINLNKDKKTENKT